MVPCLRRSGASDKTESQSNAKAQNRNGEFADHAGRSHVVPSELGRQRPLERLKTVKLSRIGKIAS
jgi:hypothetical protein